MLPTFVKGTYYFYKFRTTVSRMRSCERRFYWGDETEKEREGYIVDI